ncbi:hypothetical protein Trydic_g15318 [Trypoxylus dichotomus]
MSELHLYSHANTDPGSYRKCGTLAVSAWIAGCGFDDDAVNDRTVQKWFNKFSSRDLNLTDRALSGRMLNRLWAQISVERSVGSMRKGSIKGSENEIFLGDKRRC